MGSTFGLTGEMSTTVTVTGVATSSRMGTVLRKATASAPTGGVVIVRSPYVTGTLLSMRHEYPAHGGPVPGVAPTVIDLAILRCIEKGKHTHGASTGAAVTAARATNFGHFEGTTSVTSSTNTPVLMTDHHAADVNTCWCTKCARNKQEERPR